MKTSKFTAILAVVSAIIQLLIFDSDKPMVLAPIILYSASLIIYAIEEKR